MPREYVTVTLTARVDGDRVVLIDGNGNPIRAIRAVDARTADASVLEAIELRHTWSSALAGMIGGNLKATQRHKRSAWDAKISVWVVSLRHRRNRTRPNRSRSGPPRPKFRSQTWEQRLDHLTAQHIKWKKKCESREENPWSLWAETVSGNLRKRGYLNEDSKAVSQQAEPGAKTERSVVPVRSDGGEAATSVVVA